MHNARLVLFLGAIATICLTSCASSQGDANVAGSASSSSNQRVPIPGEQRDYAGHPCGNPYAHVKTHPCVFPQK